MPVRVGLVGAGAMGRRHLEALSRDARVSIVGVADNVEAAARGVGTSTSTPASPRCARYAMKARWSWK